jgi:2,4-dichlorophenol 6-monooxygenase
MTQPDNPSPSINVPVLIVGAGPIGLLSALMLSHQGIPSMLIERRFERMTAPKAHAVNPRTLEICANLGIDIDEIYNRATPVDQGNWVRFGATLSGPTFGRLPYERQDGAVRDRTPYPLANIAQPDLEEIIAIALESRKDVTILRGAQCDLVRQDDDAVVTSIALRGNQTPMEIRSDFVLAADGAGSRVRGMMGIEMEGPEALQNYMMIHFDADLSHITKSNPGFLHFILDPDIGGVLLAFDEKSSWVLMHGFDPNAENIDDYTSDKCIELVQRAIGQSVEGIKIQNTSPWAMSSQVADSYSKGRVFFLGDAAHRFPPTGGLGLNTGVGDAQNITWKMAALLKGWAEPTLLDTYEKERKAVARINSDQSLENSMKIFEIFGAVYGPDPVQQRSFFDSIGDEVVKDTGPRPELDAVIEV